jgi:hypothetical protein
VGIIDLKITVVPEENKICSLYKTQFLKKPIHKVPLRKIPDPQRVSGYLNITKSACNSGVFFVDSSE